MIILTTVYNCENYIDRCLSSIMLQSFKDFKCYITDDLSTDNSIKVIEEKIKNDDRFILIKNTKKLYQPGNYDNVLRNFPEIDDNEIVIEVDGDDWLPDNKVFERVNNVYKNKKIWIANGSFMYPNGVIGFSQKQQNFNDLRNSRFTATHLRTWKVFLWREIEQEDLKDDEGNYWKVTGDLSFMFPMLEMSGEKHYCFMPEINYVYNDSNPLNDHKVDLSLVNEIADKIRKKIKYGKL